IVEACAGMIDGGETAEAAAMREAREELGAKLSDLRPLGAVYLSPGVSTERTTLFAASYGPMDRVAVGGGAAAEGEDIEVVEMTLGEAVAAIGRGEIADAKTVALVLAVRL